MASMTSFASKKTAFLLGLAALFGVLVELVDISGNGAKLDALVYDFNKGGELICKDDTQLKPLRITNKRYELRENRLVFIGDHGFDLLDQECRSKSSELIATNIWYWIFSAAALLCVVLALWVFDYELLRKERKQ